MRSRVDIKKLRPNHFWSCAQKLRQKIEKEYKQQCIQNDAKDKSRKPGAAPSYIDGAHTKYSQKNVAEKLGTNPSTLSRLENRFEESSKNLYLREAYIKYCGITLTDLEEEIKQYKAENNTTICFSHLILNSPILVSAKFEEDLELKFTSQRTGGSFEYVDSQKGLNDNFSMLKHKPMHSRDWAKTFNSSSPKNSLLVSAELKDNIKGDLINVAQLCSNNRSKLCFFYDKKRHPNLALKKGVLFETPKFNGNNFWNEKYSYSKFFRFHKYIKSCTELKNNDPKVRLFFLEEHYAAIDVDNFKPHWASAFKRRPIKVGSDEQEIIKAIRRNKALTSGLGICAFAGVEPMCNHIFQSLKKFYSERTEPISIGMCEAKSSDFYESRTHHKSTLNLYAPRSEIKNLHDEIENFVNSFESSVGLIKEAILSKSPKKRSCIKEIANYFNIPTDVVIRELKGTIYDYKLGFSKEYLKYIKEKE